MIVPDHHCIFIFRLISPQISKCCCSDLNQVTQPLLGSRENLSFIFVRIILTVPTRPVSPVSLCTCLSLRPLLPSYMLQCFSFPFLCSLIAPSSFMWRPAWSLLPVTPKLRILFSLTHTPTGDTENTTHYYLGETVLPATLPVFHLSVSPSPDELDASCVSCSSSL